MQKSVNKKTSVYDILQGVTDKPWQLIQLMGHYNATANTSNPKNDDVTLSSEDRGGMRHTV